MVRSVLVGALLVVVGAAAASVVISWRAPIAPPGDEERAVPAPLASGRGFGAIGERRPEARSPTDMERRIKGLEAQQAADAAERQRLEERFNAVAAQLAARGGTDETTPPAAGATAAAAAVEPPANQPTNQAADANAIDYSKSAMERALSAAGVDSSTAADIKRRNDQLALSEIYLRDQATREEWLDSPRFADEMAALAAQRTPIREQIGDEAYDRYLYAMGQLNRVRVDEVLSESPAAQAGLQPGDMIVRYGATRIFSPDELVAETRGGTAGEAVQVEVIRNGARFEVEVPRGPLGLQIAGTQAAPTS